MAEALMLIEDTHAAQDIASGAGDFNGDGYIISFSQRNLRGGSFARTFQLAQPKGQKLSFGEFGQHYGELALRELERRDWFAKLNAAAGILTRFLVAGHRRANHAPDDPV